MRWGQHLPPIHFKPQIFNTRSRSDGEGETEQRRVGTRGHHFWFRSWLESQSSPSYRPSPLVAQVAWMYQFLWRNECSPSLSVISAAFMALGRSWGRRPNCLKQAVKNTSRQILIEKWLWYNRYDRGLPVCWQILIKLLLWARPQQAFSWVPRVLRWHALCRYCLQRRWDLLRKEHYSP